MHTVREKGVQSWETVELIISEFNHMKRGHHETLETELQNQIINSQEGKKL